jgi:hypothetical protein
MTSALREAYSREGLPSEEASQAGEPCTGPVQAKRRLLILTRRRTVTVCSCSDRAEQAIPLSRHGGIMTYQFIICFLARCALIGARRCSSESAKPAASERRAAFTSLADSDPGHLQARASRVRQHNKLLRPTDQSKRHGRGVGTRTEAEGRRPPVGPGGGSRETPAEAAGESSTQRIP